MKNNLILSVILCLFSVAVFANKPISDSKIVHDFYAAVDAGNFENAGKLLSDDVKVFIPFSPNAPMDKTSYKQLGMGMKAGFPDMKHKVLETYEGQGTVTFKALFSGTNTGLLQGNPPTGNHVESPFMGLIKLDKTGKISEFNVQFDVASFNMQLMAGIDPKMAAEKNIRELFKLMDEGQTEKFPVYCAAEFKIMNPFLQEPSPIQAFQGILQTQKTAFPDMQHEILAMIVEGNKVVTKGIFKGTNTGSMMGNPPTGNRVEIPFLVLDELDATNGKLLNRDVQFNAKSFEAQLMKGVNPTEANISLANYIFESLNKHDLEAVISKYSPIAKFNGWAPQQLDLNGYKAMMGSLLNAFPDAVFIIDDIVTEGDNLVIRHHLQGTHTGTPFLGVKASKKQVFVPATVTIHLQKGLPYELWLNADLFGMMAQLGAVSLPQN